MLRTGSKSTLLAVSHPNALFATGTLIALLPYVWWTIAGPNDSYIYEVSYRPILIWLVGLAAFVGAGALRPIASLALAGRTPGAWYLAPRALGGAFWGIIAILAFAAPEILSVYGGVPILIMIGGAGDVDTFNQMQRESIFGLFGLTTALVFTANLLLLVIFVHAREIGKDTRWIIIASWVGLLAYTAIAGKRQGAFVMTSALFFGLTIASSGKPFQLLFSGLGLEFTRVRALFLSISVLACLYIGTEYLGNVRVADIDLQYRSASEMFFAYLEFPLMNMEAQVAATEMWLGTGDWVYPLTSLVPEKLLWAIDYLPKVIPYRPEPTIGAGFFGNLHWGGGVVAVALGGAICGLISHTLYSRALTDPWALCMYAHLSWTLLAANTYNHFLNLVFFPLPALILYVILRLSGKRLRDDIPMALTHTTTHQR